MLYPAPLRDLLVELAATGLFRARWTSQIHDEWTRNLLRNRPELDPGKLALTARLMNEAVPDALVTGYEDRIAGLVLPDPDDRHVLAAAVHAGCDAIITLNLKDFPSAYLQTLDVEVLHPDDFILRQFGVDELRVLNAARNCRRRLRNPPKSAFEYLQRLDAQGLSRTVSHLRAYEETI